MKPGQIDFISTTALHTYKDKPNTNEFAATQLQKYQYNGIAGYSIGPCSFLDNDISFTH